MRKLLLITSQLLIVTNLVLAQELHLEDFTQGKVDLYDATRIPDNSVSDCRNVYFDGEYPAEKRKGMLKLNSTAVGDGAGVLSQFEYKMSDGTRYHIVHSSETVYYRLSGSAFTVLKNGVSSTYPCNYTVFMDTLTWVDGVNNMVSWDTSATFTQEATYQPRFIIAWQNRLWIAGDAGERSKVRCCEWLDPRHYTVPATPVYTDPAVFDINSQDGQKVMGFFLSPNGNLGILKEKSVWEIGGYDRSDFYLRMVIPDIGCIDSGSVAYKEGVVSWLSKEGFVGYDGHTFSVISDNIASTIDDIQQMEIGTGQFFKNEQSEWQVYDSTNHISLTDSPGDLQIDLEVAETIASPTIDHSLMVNMEIDSNETIYMIYKDVDANLKEMTYEDSNAYTPTTIASTMSGSLHFNDALAIGTDDVKHVIFADALSGGFYDLKYASASATTWSEREVDADTYQGAGLFTPYKATNAAVDVESNDYPCIAFCEQIGASSMRYDLMFSSYNGTAWQTAIAVDDGYSAGQTRIRGAAVLEIDSGDVVHIAYTEYSIAVLGLPVYYVKYASGTLDGGFSLKSWIIYSKITGAALDMEIDSNDNACISYTKNGNDLWISSYTGTGATWSTTQITDGLDSVIRTNIDIDSNDNIGIMYTDYGTNIRYASYYDNAWTDHELVNDYASTALADFMFDAKDYPIGVGSYSTYDGVDIFPSTATYISAIYDTGITGSFYMDEFTTSEILNEQNIAHYVRADYESAYVATNTWTSVAVGGVPAITGKQYMQYKCVISTTILTDSIAVIDRIRFGYHTSEGGAFLSSMNYDGRVWNAVTISSATYLDRQLIWDWNNNWTDFTSGIGCKSLFNYNGTPYWGSDDGYVYVMDVGNNDDGDPIESWIETKAYNMGTLVQEKTLDKVFVIADNSGNWNLTLDYYLDRSKIAENSFDIDLDQTDNLINYKVPITKQLPFYTLQFKLSNNNADEPWSLLGIHAYGRELPLR